MSPTRHAPRALLALYLLASAPLAAQPLEPAPVTEPAAEPAPGEPSFGAPESPDPAAAAPAPPALKLSPRQQIAKELFERGREQWRLGEYAEAAALLTASNEQAERPGTLLLLGESLEKLGRLRSAHDTFESAARAAQRLGDTSSEARAGTRAAALLPRIPKMEIRFSAPPPEGTLVTLNGVELPREWLNRPVPFDAAEYRLDVRAPGYAPYSAPVVLTNDGARLGVQVVPVVLTPLPAEPEPPPLMPFAPLQPDDAGPSRERRLAWISGGIGAAAATAGITLLLVALDKKRDAGRNRCGPAIGVDDPDACDARGVDLRKQANALAHMATASALVSGAALASSFTLFVLSAESEAPAGAGVRYSASF